MGFFAAIRVCLVKYFDFNGRASRPEYFYFVLFVFLSNLCLGLFYRPLGMAWSLGVLLPHCAVAARRLHDTNRSAWWLLLELAPLVGWIMLVIWFCQRGNEQANRFGDPPPPSAAPMTAPI